jgi:hypothetical protein
MRRKRTASTEAPAKDSGLGREECRAGAFFFSSREDDLKLYQARIHTQALTLGITPTRDESKRPVPSGLANEHSPILAIAVRAIALARRWQTKLDKLFRL